MKNFKLIFCLLCLFLISKISFSQATLNELDLSIFGIEPSLFEMSESQFINMNKEKKFEVKKAGSYTTWVYGGEGDYEFE